MTAARARTIGWLGLLGLLGLLAGCAPRLSALVERKHYREAICAADDGGARRRRVVSEALAADTGTYVHVHALTPGELAARLGDPALAELVLSRVALVKVVVQTNTLPIDALNQRMVVRGEDMGAGAAPLGWDTLAVATGERVPAAEQHVSYASVGNVLRGLGVFLTAGVSLPYTHFQPRVRVVAPSLQVYARQMPRAAAVLGALAGEGCRAEGPGEAGLAAGQRCAGYFVLDRSPATQWTLSLAQTYVATREVADGASCSHERTASVQIGRMDEWEGRFGARMRMLEELPAGPATQGWTRTRGG